MQTDRTVERKAEGHVESARGSLRTYVREDVDPREFDATVDIALCAHEDVIRFRLMRFFPGLAPAISHCINPYIEQTDGEH